MTISFDRRGGDHTARRERGANAVDDIVCTRVADL
jgi:hypothetical protein